VFLGVALCYRLPFILYQHFEDGTVKMLCFPIGPGRSTGDNIKARAKFSSKYMVTHKNTFSTYIAKYFLYNWTHFACSSFAFITINYFFNGNYLRFGMSFFLSPDEYVLDGFELMFPLQASCTPSSSGPSGGTQVDDFLCALPLNSLNRVLFFVLW
jgi:hypothetical protein